MERYFEFGKGVEIKLGIVKKMKLLREWGREGEGER